MKIPNKAIADMKVDIKFSPELIIYFGENELGRITCKDTKDLGKLFERLRKSIEDIIKELEDEGKKIVKDK